MNVTGCGTPKKGDFAGTDSFRIPKLRMVSESGSERSGNPIPFRSEKCFRTATLS
jgi:hypothetical protein